jgi:hypothetical protein
MPRSRPPLNQQPLPRWAAAQDTFNFVWQCSWEAQVRGDALPFNVTAVVAANGNSLLIYGRGFKWEKRSKKLPASTTFVGRGGKVTSSKIGRADTSIYPSSRIRNLV